MSLLDIALVVVAYLAGAVPFGVLVARAMGVRDLQSRGSGNIGATNVNRTLGRGAGAVTLLLDVLKGFAPVWVAAGWGQSSETAFLAAAAAVLGHIFPVFLRFRGGKGVATGFGVLMALHFPTALIAFTLWVTAVAVSKVSAVGALAGFGSLPVVAWLWGPSGWFLPFACALSVVVLVRHTDNVRRLIAERRR
ncbi:MAG: glycerol-3-phosphate 1-O-acyltransferase PlsY [Nitrospirota bacterium]|nr:glycerol-3-phosphate 1-O-acyltransferase PlsY [Nitrospirota bacterium]